jgi:hypothetical protein
MLISGRIVSLIMTIIFALILYYLPERAKRVKIPEIRKLPAIAALEEAIGRCAEMGRPAHFTAGLAYLTTDTGPQTLAAMGILGYISRICARLGVPLVCSICNPQTIPLHEEMVKQGYIVEGRPEDFRRDYSIRYISDEQRAYSAGVIGTVLREKPAANIVIGPLYGEIYTLLECGRPVGALTIGGTARIVQVPVVVVMSDFALIGEEMFAASAFLTEDPEERGLVFGRDIIKWICLGLLVIGILLSLPGFNLPALLSK